MKSNFISFKACNNMGSSVPSMLLYGCALAAFSEALEKRALEVDIFAVGARDDL